MIELVHGRTVWRNYDVPGIALAVSPDDHMFAAFDGSIPGVRICDTDTGRELFVFRYPANPGADASARISFGPDGRTVMLCWSRGTAEWTVKPADLGSPPSVHPDNPDPIKEFRTYYRQIGYHVDATGQPVPYDEP
jgi:hypothetical protein